MKMTIKFCMPLGVGHQAMEKRWFPDMLITWDRPQRSNVAAL